MCSVWIHAQITSIDFERRTKHLPHTCRQRLFIQIGFTVSLAYHFQC